MHAASENNVYLEATRVILKAQHQSCRSGSANRCPAECLRVVLDAKRDLEITGSASCRLTCPVPSLGAEVPSSRK